MHARRLALLSALVAVLPAQDPALGQAAPALAIDKWVAGQPLARFEPGTVYVVEFWGIAPDFGFQRRRAFDRLHDRCAGKVQALGVMHGTDTFGFAEVREHYEAFGKTLAFRIGWDEGRALHGSWRIAADGAPVACVVDGQGRLVWKGGFTFLPFVLPQVLAGDVDCKGLAAATEALRNRVLGIYLAASLKPEKVAAEVEKLLAEHPFLTESLLPDVYGTLMEDGQHAVAMHLARRLLEFGIAEKDAGLLNGLAWSIVDPAAKLANRDLALALRAAQAAAEFTEAKNADVLDTLARVCFWQKDYAAAVRWQQQAVGLETDDEAKTALAATLAEYEALAGKR